MCEEDMKVHKIDHLTVCSMVGGSIYSYSDQLVSVLTYKCRSAWVRIECILNWDLLLAISVYIYLFTATGNLSKCQIIIVSNQRIEV